VPVRIQGHIMVEFQVALELGSHLSDVTLEVLPERLLRSCVLFIRGRRQAKV
jgi:hypothetical protein